MLSHFLVRVHDTDDLCRPIEVLALQHDDPRRITIAVERLGRGGEKFDGVDWLPDSKTVTGDETLCEYAQLISGW